MRLPRLLRSSTAALAALAALAGVALSCLEWEHDVEHCWWAEGNTTCYEEFRGELPYCSNDSTTCGVEGNLGCMATRPLRGECYSPCGLGLTFDEEGECAYTSGEAECGNGLIEFPEECDEGPNNHPYNSCLDSCRDNVCGDGYLGPGEVCDDGNYSNSDECVYDCEPADCGDGYRQLFPDDEEEECDMGPNNSNTGSCTLGCHTAVCGDGLVHEGKEDCDDGNGSNNDDCTNDCNFAACGDGFPQPGEECDDGNTIEDDSCLSNCEAAECGDGIVYEGAESCDDGNATDTDACPTTCEDAACGDGFIYEGMEECDDGNTSSGDGCNSACMSECGDGVIQGTEKCDGADFGGATCETETEGGFPFGSLSCNVDCTISDIDCF